MKLRCSNEMGGLFVGMTIVGGWIAETSGIATVVSPCSVPGVVDMVGLLQREIKMESHRQG